MLGHPLYVVAQLGARMHYGVPRLLAKAGMLERLYTDVYAGPTIRKLSHVLPVTGTLARWGARCASGIPDKSVFAFPTFGIRYAARLRLVRTQAERSAAYLWAGRRFGDLVCSRGFGKATAVYTYNDASLEILRRAREHGLFSVLEQTIAPLATESALLDVEHAMFPGWEGHVPDRALGERCSRQQAEWETADLIVCGSNFVADCIRETGGPVDRCKVVPYGVDRVRFAPPRPTRGNSGLKGDLPARRAHTPLRVLTVGAAGLRKGTPYIWQAAREMGGDAEFRLVGPTHLAASVRLQVGRHVQMLGPVPRSAILEHYDWADVFLLPSICEGSATVCYEALAAGLPVITTPNTGSVVRDGVEGFIVPIRSGESIAERLQMLAAQPALLSELSANALQRASQFTLEEYGNRLLAALETHCSGNGVSL